MDMFPIAFTIIMNKKKTHTFQVSLPDVGDSTVNLMNAIYTTMQSHLQGYNLWQVCYEENKCINCRF
jgi:hypothetical protein